MNRKRACEVLGISPTASDAEIISAYRKNLIKAVNERDVGWGDYPESGEERLRRTAEYSKRKEVLDAAKTALKTKTKDPRERREEQRDEPLAIPRNDIALLEGLILAYRSKGEKIWEVAIHDEDKRDRPWMPGILWRIARNADGSVKVSRRILEWLKSREKTTEIRMKDPNDPSKEGSSSRPDAFFREVAFGQGTTGDRFWGHEVDYPRGYRSYLDTLKKIAARTVIEGVLSFEIDELALIRLYTEGTVRDSSMFGGRPDGDIRREIEMGDVWRELYESAKDVRVVKRRTVEGQTSSVQERKGVSSPEGGNGPLG